MSQTDSGMPAETRPACDNCKHRKTKCDRQLPCASCVTLKVPCRHSRRTTEKRQRVLISSKYEEAVQDVSRQIADVKSMLERLVLSNQQGPVKGGVGGGTHPHSSPAGGTDTATPSSGKTYHTPRGMINEQVPTLSGVRDGYNGDSSFQSHAYRIENALETLAASELLKLASPASQSTREMNSDENLSTAGTQAVSSSQVGSLHPPNGDMHDVENMPLPPMELVLKLLRLAKVEKQRFFIDFNMFDEEEFTNLCRDIYFATEPIALWAWISCNVGLYFLFLGLDTEACARLGTTLEAMRVHTKTLMENAERAMQSLRLCSEPSLEWCRTLALLATFYVKLGHTTVAWRLISGAARAALDLGLHRLTGDPDGQKPSRFTIFWYIYTWDKGLAMTCGRAPTIHHYDVTTKGPETVTDRADVPTRVYCAFIEYAIITGEIQQQLFSPAAQRSSQSDWMQKVQSFAIRLKAILESVTSVKATDPGFSKHFEVVIVTLEMMMYSLLAMVYRLAPPASVPAHPLRCSEECVDAARKGLARLVESGEKALNHAEERWTLMLNTILSLVPFVSFIILTGNAIATSSSADLDFLSSVLAVLAPPAKTSPLAKNIHDACERFAHIARIVVSAAGTASGDGTITVDPSQTAQGNGSVPGQFVLPSQNMPIDGVGNPLVDADCGFPMAQQDWDSVMMGYEDELGAFDARTLTNVIEPYFAHSGW